MMKMSNDFPKKGSRGRMIRVRNCTRGTILQARSPRRVSEQHRRDLLPATLSVPLSEHANGNGGTPPRASALPRRSELPKLPPPPSRSTNSKNAASDERTRKSANELTTDASAPARRRPRRGAPSSPNSSVIIPYRCGDGDPPPEDDITNDARPRRKSSLARMESMPARTDDSPIDDTTPDDGDASNLL